MTITHLVSLGAARSSWIALEMGTRNVFSTWDWADAWWTVHGRRGTLEILAVHSAGTLVALLPLYRMQRRGIQVLRFIGHGEADELGPICAPEHRAIALQAMETVARGLGARELLLAERLAPGSPLRCADGARRVRDEFSPVLPREGRSWDEWLAQRSSNFRSEVRRRERKLVREHGLTMRLCDDPARLDADLDSLFSLHRARWSEEPATRFSASEAFHRAFAPRALSQGWLRLWLAEIDGRATAAWLGYRFAGVECYYQAGRDPEWDRYAVGTVLLGHTIREAFTDGVDEYRFGVGGESYKRRFTEDDSDVATVAMGRPATTWAVTRMADAVRALPPSARSRLVRRVV